MTVELNPKSRQVKIVLGVIIGRTIQVNFQRFDHLIQLLRYFIILLIGWLIIFMFKLIMKETVKLTVPIALAPTAMNKKKTKMFMFYCLK